MTTIKTGRTKEVLLEQKPENNGMEITFECGQFCRVPLWNPFVLVYGNTVYELDEINFYNEEGVKIKVNSGWFGSNNPHQYMGFIKDGELIEAKRKKEAKFNKQEVYFLSLGKKVFSQSNRAALYIPMAYLDNMGWEMVESKNVSEFSTFTQVDLVTPKFQHCLRARNENHFEVVKAKLMQDIEAAKTRKEVEEAFDKWGYKL